MATSGKIGVFGLSQTNYTFGNCSVFLDRETCMAALQDVPCDRRQIWGIDRRLVIDIDSDLFYSDSAARNAPQISIELALDACSEARILDLNVCDGGTCIWAGKNVNPRQSHRLSKEFKHVYCKILGVALWHSARNPDCAVVRGMFDAQDTCSRAESDEHSFEDACLYLFC